jgi:hypothetical protein
MYMLYVGICGVFTIYTNLDPHIHKCKYELYILHVGVCGVFIHTLTRVRIFVTVMQV